MINQQSAAKKHVKHEATQYYLSVTFQHDRSFIQLTAANNRNSNNEARLPYLSSTLEYISPDINFGEKNQQRMQYRDECMPLVSSVDTVYYILHHYRVAHLNNSNDFRPCFLCRKVITCFLVTTSPCFKSGKTARFKERISVCSLNRIFILLAPVQTTSMCPNYHLHSRGRSHS